jgi:predicted MFS family arabinose efflux permease
MSFFALPGVIVCIPAGILADRFSQKKIGLISLVLLITGSAMFASGANFPVLALGRAISGIGSLTLVVIGPQLVVQWFTGHRLGTAMGILNTAFPIGTVLSLNILSIISSSWGWHTSIWISAGVSLVALVMFAWLYAPAPRVGRQPSLPSEGFFHSIQQAGTAIWLVAAAWMLYNASLISLHTFTPDLLRASGFSLASAGFVTSLVMFPAMILNPLVGYMVDKIGHKRVIISSGALAFAVLVVFVPWAGGLIPELMVFIGLAWILAPAPIFILAADAVSSKRLGLGYGILSACQNIGVLIGPAITGLLRDITGSYHASYAMMSGFVFMVIPTLYFLKYTSKRLS